MVLRTTCIKTVKLTLLRLAGFGDFCTKTTGSHVASRKNFSSLVSAADPVKSSKDSASLVDCIYFAWGLRVSCDDVTSEGFLGHRPTSPGPMPKQLDGSISLKFLLETRLQSESF